jgi:hypothetical protein
VPHEFPADPITKPTPNGIASSALVPRSRWSWFSFTIGAGFSALISVSVTRDAAPSRSVEVDPAHVVPSGDLPARAETSSMDEVLRIAEDTLDHMRKNLDGYSAIMIKQETIDGVLIEPSEMAMKVHCRHRGGKLDDSEPMRVYLRFNRPAGFAGRELIWAEDLHDGKLVVHEAGLMGFMTVYLDPTGMIAMRGQRYPIYEIGLTKLVQKLIERGEVDRNNPDVTVTITRNLVIDDHSCELIVVNRKQPSGTKDDFSRAEICFDKDRQLPLRYTAYGWGKDGADAPLLESYTYTKIDTNVRLTDADFDPKNPSYRFP